MQQKTVVLNMSRADRLAGILMAQNLTYESFDVSFGTRIEAQDVLEAISKLGLRGEMHPFQDRVRLFRDTQARSESSQAGKKFDIDLVRGNGGFLSD